MPALTAAAPRLMSSVPPDTDIGAAELGAQMLGLPLTPQGRNEALVLEARDEEGGSLFRTVVIQMPRRSTKSTSIWATMIGRAMKRPGYRGLYTAQTGSIASSQILLHGAMLEANGYAGYKRSAFGGDIEGDGTMRLLRNGGREKLEFNNGSVIFVVPPSATSVRSMASDDIVIDEGGEFEGDKGTDFLNAVLPLMDTRGERAQLIVAGTPGRVRAGMFWDLLQDLHRAEDVDLGGLDYSALDTDDPEDREVWRRVHPGPSAIKADGSPLTSMRTLERRFKKMPLPMFAREYLCVWPADAATSAVDMDAWAAAERSEPVKPEKYAWAYDVAPDGSTAAVAAAWRDEDGNAWVEIMEHKQGTDWLPGFVKAATKKQRLPIVWDAIGANHEPAARMDAMKPKVRNLSLHMKVGVIPAEASFVRELGAGRMRHCGQPSLTTALDGAYWRQSEGFRLWGRKPSAGDVTPAVAAALALHRYDTDVIRRATSTGLSGMFD